MLDINKTYTDGDTAQRLEFTKEMRDISYFPDHEVDLFLDLINLFDEYQMKFGKPNNELKTRIYHHLKNVRLLPDELLPPIVAKQPVNTENQND